MDTTTNNLSWYTIEEEDILEIHYTEESKAQT